MEKTPQKSRVNPLKADPTRTTLLRKKFEKELGRRFGWLKSRILKLVVEEDAFGLRPGVLNVFCPTGEGGGIDPTCSPGGAHTTARTDYIPKGSQTPEQVGMYNLALNQRWRFRSDADKVEAFQAWLDAQIKAGVIPPSGQSAEDAFWQAYVDEGYQKGAGRAFDDTRKAKRALSKSKADKPLSFYKGTRQEFLRSASRPEAIKKVKLLAGRVFTDLKGVTEEMGVKISRALTDGLVQGKNPRAIARDLTKVVDISRSRANTIARTEIIRAHAEGALDAMEELGVTEVGVAVEWTTAGFNVCPLCSALEGVVLKISEAHGMFPRHPNCRCSPIPANVGEDHDEQLRTKSRIQAAIRKSLKAEAPKGRSVEQQKRKSTWAGAGKNIAKKRPKEIV